MKKFQTSALLGFKLKLFSKSSGAQGLSAKGLDKPGKASELTRSAVVGNYVESIAHGKRQPFPFRR